MLSKLIEWYSDHYVGIYFDKKPHTDILYPEPWMSKGEIEEVTKKPLICKNKVDVILFDYYEEKKYKFTIEKDYHWDGASIPAFFWRIIGSKTDPRFLIPSLIHDILCEHKDYVNYDRYFADKVFERLLYVAKVPAVKRWAMFHCVDNYQKFCGWRENK